MPRSPPKPKWAPRIAPSAIDRPQVSPPASTLVRMACPHSCLLCMFHDVEDYGEALLYMAGAAELAGYIDAAFARSAASASCNKRLQQIACVASACSASGGSRPGRRRADKPQVTTFVTIRAVSDASGLSLVTPTIPATSCRPWSDADFGPAAMTAGTTENVGIWSSSIPEISGVSSADLKDQGWQACRESGGRYSPSRRRRGRKR